MAINETPSPHNMPIGESHPGNGSAPDLRCVLHDCRNVEWFEQRRAWGCSDVHGGIMLPCQVEDRPGHLARPPDEVVEVAALSPFELNYRKAMGALIAHMNATQRFSNLDVRRNQLEMIAGNQVAIMQALMLTMDLLLQMCDRPPEIQFTPRESGQRAPASGLVVPS